MVTAETLAIMKRGAHKEERSEGPHCGYPGGWGLHVEVALHVNITSTSDRLGGPAGCRVRCRYRGSMANCPWLNPRLQVDSHGHTCATRKRTVPSHRSERLMSFCLVAALWGPDGGGFFLNPCTDIPMGTGDAELAPQAKSSVVTCS